MPKKVRKPLGPTVTLQEARAATAVTTTREQLVTEFEDGLCRVCGVKTPEVAKALASQVASLQVWTCPDPTRLAEALTRASCLLAELGPKNGPEALLAVQMIGVHEAGTMFLHRASAAGQTVDEVERNVLRATRLMRLFTEQLAALSKLKGRTSQQRVTVEHVHVHSGGQAIVGAVGAPKRGRNE